MAGRIGSQNGAEARANKTSYVLEPHPGNGPEAREKRRRKPITTHSLQLALQLVRPIQRGRYISVIRQRFDG